MKKQIIMRQAVIITITLFLAIALLLGTYGTLRLYSSSTETLSGGWIHTFGNGVEYLGLTVDKSQVTGQEQEEYETTGTPPNVKPGSSTVSGTVNDSQVTLTFSVYGFPVRSYTGTYENDTLTLTVSDQSGNLQSIEYHHATTDDYNSAVQKLQQEVSQQVQNYENAVATATATAYQQQLAEATATAISNEQERLAYDISNIGGSISRNATRSTEQRRRAMRNTRSILSCWPMNCLCWPTGTSRPSESTRRSMPREKRGAWSNWKRRACRCDASLCP